MPDALDAPTDDETPLEQVVAGLVIALIFLVGFGLLATGYPWFWVVFPVGFAGALPAAVGLVRWYESRHRDEADGRSDEREDALETLRDRYARGDIDEAEFERRVERLLETETLDDALEYARAEYGDESSPALERESERGRERERD